VAEGVSIGTPSRCATRAAATERELTTSPRSACTFTSRTSRSTTTSVSTASERVSCTIISTRRPPAPPAAFASSTAMR
jgi:hypothetical protein